MRRALLHARDAGRDRPQGLRDADVGDLVSVSTAAGGARVERVGRLRQAIENVLEALLVEQGAAGGVRAARRAQSELRGSNDLRDLHTFTIDPETAKDFDDAISVRRGDAASASGCTSPTSRTSFLRVAARSGSRRAGELGVCPGAGRTDAAAALADDAARCGRTRPVHGHGRDPSVPVRGGEPTFYRSVIAATSVCTYARRRSDPRGEPRARCGRGAAADRRLPATCAAGFARGALRIESAEINFGFDGKGGVERAWLESEPKAHALIEELMILANEAVAEFLSIVGAESLYPGSRAARAAGGRADARS